VSIELFNIDKGYAVFSKRDYETSEHAHYAIEMVYCTEGTFSITTGISRHINITSAIVPSNLPHTFSSINAKCNILFLDPLFDIGRYFIHQYHLASQQDIIVDPPALNQFHKKGKFDIPLLLEMAETGGAGDLDFRIVNCIQAIDSHITDHKITLSQLSKASFLSESRLSHLFRKQLGISVHQCILWKKMFLAVLKSREGYSLTACAHYAGFADSSHFNKAFYKMFGITPFFVLKS
jgi:AraC-like DNA-binding protein